MTEKNGRSIPDMSVDTRVLIKTLSEVEEGGFISYEELSGVIGRDIQQQARGNLHTARHRLEVDDAIMFGVVIGKGLRRLDSVGVMGGTDVAVKHCGRVLKRESRRLATIVPSDLTKEKQAELHVKAAQVQVLAFQTRPRVRRQLEAKLSGTGELPMAKLLDAVRDSL